jgi:hypothetical protein
MELAIRIREGYPKAAPLIDNSKFMGDFIAGFEGGNVAISIYYELTAFMKNFKLPMAKWATNCVELK